LKCQKIFEEAVGSRILAMSTILRESRRHGKKKK
jgi:hypothetical protein